jgi:thiol:disulfide interchange protein DsbC
MFRFLSILSFTVSFFLNANSVIDHERYEILNKNSDLIKIEKSLRDNLNIKDFILMDIKPINNSGFYTMSDGTNNFIVNSTGKYLIKGDILKIENGGLNFLSDNIDMDLIDIGLLKGDGIVYSGLKNNKELIVFFDYTCPYCKKFHKNEKDELIKLGYTIRYIPFLRNPNSNSVKKIMTYIFCSSENKKELLELAINGYDLKYFKREFNDFNKYKKCDIEYIYHLGEYYGVNGTPSIFDSKGRFLGGYQNYRDIDEKYEKYNKP